MGELYYFIVNPAAGGGRSGALTEGLEKLLDGRNATYLIRRTSNSDDVVRYAREAVSLKPKAVVAVGGDGTVSEVASVLARSGIPMGIIGSGSGNDFAAAVLGRRRKLKEPADEIDIVFSDKTRAFDMAEVNGELFLNIANMGLDADIAYSAEQLKERYGGSAYLAATAKEILKFKPIKCELKTDGRAHSGETMLVAVCNGRAYGGGFLIAPKADASDGFFTVCFVRKMAKPKLMAVFPTALFGKHEGFREVEFVSCRECEISFEGELLLTLDGNLSKVRGPLVFSIIPAALEILVQ